MKQIDIKRKKKKNWKEKKETNCIISLEGLLMRAVKGMHGSSVGKGSSIHVKYSEWILFCAWPPAMWGNICLIRRLACREAELDRLNFLRSSVPSFFSSLNPFLVNFFFRPLFLKDLDSLTHRVEGGINLITFCMTFIHPPVALATLWISRGGIVAWTSWRILSFDLNESS